ncbi:type III secretion system inner membrane ring lipoprotein SctJ [Bordetella bronchialis]|uniref:type III secretion system inner membrane ring lipoprotein SctJ n=1 Tax=Bordetella bronchialis TaxID=463025 RepID=UPI003D0018F4
MITRRIDRNYGPDAWRLLCLIVVAGVLALAGCTGRVELFSSTTDSEANEILAMLLQSGIPAEKVAKKSGVTLSVAESDVARALSILRQHGLPRERFEGMGKIFQKEGMISSPLEERARYIYALSQELENTLTKMDGVLIARVHVVLPDQDAVKVAKTAASAAVFIKHQPGYNLEVLKPQIRTLVAHAIPELHEDGVSVVLVTAQRPAGAALTALPPPVSPKDPDGDGKDRARPSRAWWLVGFGMLASMLAGTGFWLWRRQRSRALDADMLVGGPHLGRFGQD